jgi:hypothetical protein
MTALAFLYTAIAQGRPPETFTSNVEYLVGDELPLPSARWTVERVEETGVEYSQGGVATVRLLHCTTRD